MTEVVAPELTELKESGNKSGAFQGCKQLTKAPFPKLVSAGFCAFKDCSALEDVGTLDHLVKIGENAFAGCTSLTNFPMTLPEVISVGHYGFNGTPLTGDLSLPAVTYIGGWCFTSPKLTSLYAPNVVKMPGKGTFNGCSALTNIVVGHALKELGTSSATPYLPGGLVSFTPLMPRAMTTVSSAAFKSLGKLKSPLVWDCPDKRIIPGSFFVYCSSLSNITIGASVTNIGASAFQDISVGAEVRFLTPPSVLVDKSFYYKNKTAEKNNKRPRFYIISRSALAAWQASELVTENAATFETFKTTKPDYPGKKTFGLVKISRSSTDTQYAWVIDGTKGGLTIVIQ